MEGTALMTSAVVHQQQCIHDDALQFNSALAVIGTTTTATSNKDNANGNDGGGWT